MGDPTLGEWNEILRPLRLEMTAPGRVRVLPDGSGMRPAALLTAGEDKSEYRLAEVPQLAAIVRSLEPLTSPLWRARFARRPELRNLEVLERLRGAMQNPGDGETGRKGRILATSLYWDLIKRLPLSREEALGEAAALAKMAVAHSRAAGQPSYEIARHAVWSLEILIENRPPVETRALRALLPPRPAPPKP